MDQVIIRRDLSELSSLLNTIQGRSKLIAEHITKKFSPLHPLVISLNELNVKFTRLLTDTAGYIWNLQIFKETHYIELCDHVLVIIATIEQEMKGDKLDEYIDPLGRLLQDSKRFLGRMMNVVHKQFPLHYPRFDEIRTNVASPKRDERPFQERMNQTRVVSPRKPAIPQERMNSPATRKHAPTPRVRVKPADRESSHIPETQTRTPRKHAPTPRVRVKPSTRESSHIPETQTRTPRKHAPTPRVRVKPDLQPIHENLPLRSTSRRISDVMKLVPQVRAKPDLQPIHEKLPLRSTSRKISDFMMKLVPRWNMNFVFPRTKPVEPKGKTPKPLTETFKKNMKTATSQKALATIKHATRNSKWYLSIVCSRSGTCLAFGNRVLEINKLFQYNRFNHVVFMTPLSSGGNGDTVGIKYELPGQKRYSSIAVLKSSKNLYSDNLMYEYLAGIHFVNHMLPNYPVFLFTYGIYTRTRDITEIFQLKTDLTLQGTNFNVACEQSDKLSLLIQHVEGKTLQDMFSNGVFLINDLSKMLFMIYQALSSLAKRFTHYDLHPGNIMIMELDSPIEYVYHDEGVSFTSKYLPKIIDYGRCYFNEDQNSKQVYLEVCSTPSCYVDGLTCGKARGFGWLKPEIPRFAVNSTVKNESHDLFLLSRINALFVMNKLPPYVPTLIYGQGLPEPSHYGTVENLQYPIGQVTNVHSAKDLMKRYLRINNTLQRTSERLHIFKDKPMEVEHI